jgi:hypothetical protein
MAQLDVKMDLTALQLLELLIGFSEIEGGEEWKAPIIAIHSAIKALEEDYPELLTDVWFEDYSIRTYSERIETALATLGAAGFAEVSNPRYQYVSISHKHRRGFVDHLRKNLSKEAIEHVKEASRVFDAALTEWADAGESAHDRV